MNKIYIPKLQYSLESISYCKTCNVKHNHWCVRSNHPKEEKLNVPFIIPDLRVKYISGKWVRLRSDIMNKEFEISGSKFQPIVLGCGIQPGGLIPNQWWINTSMGGVLTIKWLGSKHGEYLPQD